MSSNIIDAVLKVMEIYQKTYADDALLVVFDHERVRGYLPGKYLDIGIKVGEPTAKYAGTITERALRTGKIQQEEQDSSRFGVPYIATAVPIYEDGKVVAAIGSGMSNQRLDTLRRGAIDLTAVIEQLSATSDHIAHSSQEVAHEVQQLASDSEVVGQEVENIRSVLKFVQDISSHANILGLNAAIEAARAGENGRGFSIVAKEVRKLSEMSKQTVVDIQNKLEQIMKAIQNVNTSIQQIAANTEEHSASLQELNGAYSHLAKTADELMQASALQSMVG
jgi:hypothetical protein